MKIVYKDLKQIHEYENNPRNNDSAVAYVAASIREFGFRVPIIIDKSSVIVAGHTRYKAAKQLGLKKVPCISADDLTEQQVKAFRLVDNKTQEIATWDLELLADELSLIGSLNMQEFGFLPSSYQKIEKMFDENKEPTKTTDSKQAETGEDDGLYEIDEDEIDPEMREQQIYICPCCGKQFQQ